MSDKLVKLQWFVRLQVIMMMTVDYCLLELDTVQAGRGEPIREYLQTEINKN